MRLLTGGLFVFSGFTKGIDPWGTLYKFEDYMGAMGLPDWTNLLLVATFLLCAYEFCIGVFLILGCFRRSTPYCAALLMGVMLPLTLWIALKDPVADCGCFGEAFTISNWTTFWKNVVLCLFIAWLIGHNARLRWIIRPHLQWIAFIVSAGYITAVGLAGYVYQPLIDYRPYPTGSLFIAADNDEAEDDEEEIHLVYQRDGVEKTFSIDDELPDEDSGWEFVRRDIGEHKEGDTPDPDAPNTAGDFRIWDEDGEDITEEVLTDHGRELLLLMPDMGNVSVATTLQINSMKSWAEDNDISMCAIVAGTPEEIASWKDVSLPDYPIYTAEDTQIKMLARGNPAVVYIDNGTIRWKTTLRALGTKDFQSPTSSNDPMHYARDNRALLMNATYLYFIILAVLVFLSFVPGIGKFFFSTLRKGNVQDSHTGRENIQS